MGVKEITSKPIAFASSTRGKQSRNAEPLSPRPSAERGKNSYHAANCAAGRSTMMRGYDDTNGIPAGVASAFLISAALLLRLGAAALGSAELFRGRAFGRFVSDGAGA